MSAMGNRHALNDFFRTRTKPSTSKESNEKEEEDEEMIQGRPVFKRPAKKEILTNDDDEDNQFIPIRVPVELKIDNNNANDDDEIKEVKLKSIRKQTRGVLSTNEKKSTSKSLAELSEEKTDEQKQPDDDDDDDNDEDVNDEFFEP